VRKLSALGLGDIVAEPDPMLPECAEAISAWNWLGGWFPDRLPAYVSLHGCDDLELLTDLLIVIRDHDKA
jgi:hypothetical protein